MIISFCYLSLLKELLSFFLSNNNEQKKINWLTGLVWFAWGGLIIGWWLAYPLGHETGFQECRNESLTL